MPTQRRGLRALMTLAIGMGGCGQGASSNQSPNSEQAPERFQQALRETREKVRKDQEAERKAFRHLGQRKPPQ